MWLTVLKIGLLIFRAVGVTTLIVVGRRRSRANGATRAGCPAGNPATWR